MRFEYQHFLESFDWVEAALIRRVRWVQFPLPGQMSNVLNVSDDTFQSEVLGSSIPVLVDFWAEWCGPCKSISSHIESVASEVDGKARVVKINIDENPKTPSEYNIRSIPTLLVFKDGKVAGQMVGNPGSKSKISDLIKKHLDL